VRIFRWLCQLREPPRLRFILRSAEDSARARATSLSLLFFPSPGRVSGETSSARLLAMTRLTMRGEGGGGGQGVEKPLVVSGALEARGLTSPRFRGIHPRIEE